MQRDLVIPGRAIALDHKVYLALAKNAHAHISITATQLKVHGALNAMPYVALIASKQPIAQTKVAQVILLKRVEASPPPWIW